MKNALLLALCVAACAHLDPEAQKRSLIEADARFAREVAERGANAWADTFAEDGAMFGEGDGVTRGRETIRREMQVLGDPRVKPGDLQIRWKPLGARVSDDGTLGWTYGNGTLISARGERKTKYVTIWRKQSDGTWKVEADLGTPGWADPSQPP